MDICDELEAKWGTVHSGAFNAMRKAKREIEALRAALSTRRGLTDEQVLMIGRRAMDKCFGTEAQHLYIAREVERAHGVDA